MIQKILTLAFCFMLLGCSNDDVKPEQEEAVTTPKLESFKYLELIVVEDMDDWMQGLEFYLDAEQKITKSNFVIEGIPIPSERFYFYHPDGSRNKIEYRHQGDLYATFLHEYGTSNELTKITFQHEDGPEKVFDYEYGQNSIDIISNYDGWTSTYTFNGEKLIKIDDGYTNRIFDFIYTGDNVTQILVKIGAEVIETFTIQYDDKLNPLHSLFMEDSFFYSEVYAYPLELVYYFSANNFTSIHHDRGNIEFTEIIEIEYNELDQPVSSISTKTNAPEPDIIVRKLDYTYY